MRSDCRVGKAGARQAGREEAVSDRVLGRRRPKFGNGQEWGSKEKFGGRRHQQNLIIRHDGEGTVEDKGKGNIRDDIKILSWNDRETSARRRNRELGGGPGFAGG